MPFAKSKMLMIRMVSQNGLKALEFCHNIGYLNRSYLFKIKLAASRLNLNHLSCCVCFYPPAALGKQICCLTKQRHLQCDILKGATSFTQKELDSTSEQKLSVLQRGIDPIKILQRKFYATLFFKHSDWLKNVSSQSKCLKNSIA